MFEAYQISRGYIAAFFAPRPFAGGGRGSGHKDSERGFPADIYAIFPNIPYFSMKLRIKLVDYFCAERTEVARLLFVPEKSGATARELKEEINRIYIPFLQIKVHVMYIATGDGYVLGDWMKIEQVAKKKCKLIAYVCSEDCPKCSAEEENALGNAFGNAIEEKAVEKEAEKEHEPVKVYIPKHDPHPEEAKKVSLSELRKRKQISAKTSPTHKYPRTFSFPEPAASPEEEEKQKTNKSEEEPPSAPEPVAAESPRKSEEGPKENARKYLIKKPIKTSALKKIEVPQSRYGLSEK